MSASPASGLQADLLTADLADHRIAIPITLAQEVFVPQAITPVPRTRADVAGLLNLRGHIVTLIDPAVTLGVASQIHLGQRPAIGVRIAGDRYGLLVDRLGDVVSPGASGEAPLPTTLPAAWRAVARGLVQQNNTVLTIIDPVRIIGLDDPSGPLAQQGSRP